MTADRHVLVTHADEPLGQRLVRALHHDATVGRIVAVGSGPPPRGLQHLLRGPTPSVRYVRADLARHRPVADLFHSLAARGRSVDTVVHLPHHDRFEPDRRPTLARVASRTAAARLVLHHCLEQPTVRQLVTVGSAFVYRLEPGNANRCDESSPLALDPDVAPELRSWIDCDMLFHGEIHNDELQVALLRVPAVVASGGALYFHPALAMPGPLRPRPLGFDPLCALVSEKDVVRAVRMTIDSRARGIFNIAGRESVPLSTLLRWTQRLDWPLPGPLLHAGAAAARLLGGGDLGPALDAPHLRYGMTLDTRRAAEELGYLPAYRIGLDRSADGRLRVESAPV